MEPSNDAFFGDNSQGLSIMGAQDPKTLWIRPLFDVSQPYLYVVILPPLILFALGLRRFALLYFVGAAAAMAILGMA